MDQWDIERSAGTCCVTGNALAEGEEHYAVLFEDGDSFRREDYSIEAWTSPPENAFCFFKTRVPVKEQKKRLFVDNDVLVNFFLRLAGEERETRVHFRFVLALILMRKRLLRYEETVHDDGDEYWVMRIPKEDVLHRVENPKLNDEQIERVSRELGAILHGDMGQFDDPDEQSEPNDGDNVDGDVDGGDRPNNGQEADGSATTATAQPSVAAPTDAQDGPNDDA